MHKIFISHSSKDKGITKILTDDLLICGMGFDSSDIFCTSIEGMGIKTADDWRNSIKEHLDTAKIVLLLLTPNYKESEICLNEMGAAWALDKKVIPILVPTNELTFSSIGVTFDIKQAIDITEDSSVDNLRDCICGFLSQPLQDTARWNAKKMEASEEIKGFLTDNPFNKPVTRNELDSLRQSLSKTKATLTETIKNNIQLILQIDLLEKAKDKESIVEIKHKMGLLDGYDVFCKKLKSTKTALEKINPTIRTIVFNEFAKKDLKYSRGNAFSEAVAKEIINEDGFLDYRHPLISDIDRILTSLKSYFNNELSEITYNRIAEEYPGIKLELSSLDFWEQVLDVKLQYAK